MHFCLNVDQDNPPFLSRQQSPFYSSEFCSSVGLAARLTRPCCEVSGEDCGISAIISMAIDACCGKQGIRGFLQNQSLPPAKLCHSFNPQRQFREKSRTKHSGNRTAKVALGENAKNKIKIKQNKKPKYNNHQKKPSKLDRN